MNRSFQIAGAMCISQGFKSAEDSQEWARKLEAGELTEPFKLSSLTHGDGTEVIDWNSDGDVTLDANDAAVTITDNATEEDGEFFVHFTANVSCALNDVELDVILEDGIWVARHFDDRTAANEWLAGGTDDQFVPAAIGADVVKLTGFEIFDYPHGERDAKIDPAAGVQITYTGYMPWMVRENEDGCDVIGFVDINYANMAEPAAVAEPEPTGEREPATVE